MKKYCIILILFAAMSSCSAQHILNGDFENNTSGGCAYNLPNTYYTSYMANSVGFGAAEQLDIQGYNCTFGPAYHGEYFVSLANSSPPTYDAFSLTMSAPMIAGQSYTISYFQRADTFYFASVDSLLIGLSSGNATFGTRIHASLASMGNSWYRESFTFVAPINGSYITVANQGAVYGWNFVDYFRVVANTIRDTINQTICQGSSFSGYNITGTYIDTFVSAITDYDSIRVLNLIVKQVPKTNVSATICAGQNYAGHSVSSIYTDTFAVFCDSIRTLDLTVLPPVNDTIHVSICAGDKYAGHDSSGIYTDTFPGASIHGCDSTFTIDLSVLAIPVVNLTIYPIGDTIPLGPVSVSATATYTDTLMWYLNENATVLINNHLPISGAGDYCITLVGMDRQCADTISKCIYVFEDSFTVPDAFTPNGDNKNDLFYPVFINDRSEVSSLKIYNRWGQLVYDDPMKGWDGTYKEVPQSAGVYSYFLTVQIADPSHVAQVINVAREGTFTLLR